MNSKPWLPPKAPFNITVGAGRKGHALRSVGFYECKLKAMTKDKLFSERTDKKKKKKEQRKTIFFHFRMNTMALLSSVLRK